MAIDIGTIGRGVGRAYKFAATLIGYLIAYGLMFVLGVAATATAFFSLIPMIAPQAPPWVFVIALMASFVPTLLGMKYLIARNRGQGQGQGQEVLDLVNPIDPNGARVDYTASGIAVGFWELIWDLFLRGLALVISLVVLAVLAGAAYFLWTSLTVPVAIIIGAVIIGFCILALGGR